MLPFSVFFYYQNELLCCNQIIYFYIQLIHMKYSRLKPLMIDEEVAFPHVACSNIFSVNIVTHHLIKKVINLS